MGAARFEFRKVTPTCGAEVWGVDLSQALADAQIETLKAALAAHGVLFFRDQRMTPEQQKAFGRRFGELHLHPAWQQRVLGDLQRAFPEIQFIVTTHSPQVLTTVRREHIRLLAADGTATIPSDGTYGAESSRVLEEVFGVHSRPQEAQPVADLRAYLAMVEEGKAKTPKALAMRNALEDALGKHDPDLHLADIRASQLEVLGRR